MRALRPAGPGCVAWLALLVTVGALAWPAMTGTWVYDDAHMVDNPAMDDLDDVVAAWGRTSSDYLTPDDEGLESGYTWRPLTMATLIAVHATTDASATAHHVTSWALHGAVFGVLLLAAARARGRLDGIALIAVGTFALHPAAGEAWLWINGRSDLVAALGVALAGRAVTPHRDGRPLGPAAPFAFAAAALVGVLGKEVALPAAAAVAVAAALPGRLDPGDLRRTPHRVTGLARAALRRFAPLALALFAVAFVWRAGRLAAAETTGSFAGVSIAEIVARAPLALALAGESLVAPVPRPMRSLAWEYFVGWTPGRAVVFAAMCGILAATVWRGRLRSTVLLLGAAAALAPSTLVADFDWLGFDRYLYVPMVLVGLAVLWDAPRIDRADLPTRWWAAAALAAALTAAALFGQARIYANHDAWVQAMIALQPENPAGHVKHASWQAGYGHVDDAAARLADLVDRPIPPAVRHDAANVALRLGRPDLAAAHVEAAWREAPDAPTVQLDVLMLRASQHRWDDVDDLAEPLLDVGLTCGRTRVALDAWLDAGVVPPTHTERLAARIADAECP